MTKLLRVKRKVGEESVAALTSVKRARLDDVEGSSVFQYVGTVASDAVQLPGHVLSTVNGAAKKSKQQLERSFKKPVEDADVGPESRQRRAAADRKERRFRVVSSHRERTPLEVSGLTLIDVMEAAPSRPASPVPTCDITCNGERLQPIPAAAAGAEGDAASFVYDLYLCNSDEPLLGDLELVSYGQDPFLWDHRGRAEDDPFADEDSDSNAEGHWGNDYPDELNDSDYLHCGLSDGEAEMDLVRQLQDGRLSDGSVQDEQDLLRGEDKSGYQRFKRRVMRDLADGESSSDDEADDGDVDSGEEED